MDLLKILGIGVPLTISSLFGFSQKDTTFVSNDTIPKIINIKQFGDSVIVEKQYTLYGSDYKLSSEKTSNNKRGKIIYTSEIEYSYKSRRENVDYYDKKSLGPNFKERLQIDKFENDALLTFYQYNDEGKLDKIEKKNKSGDKVKTKTEYFLYKGKEQPIKWEDNNDNGKFDEGDKMFISIEGNWVEVEPKKNSK